MTPYRFSHFQLKRIRLDGGFSRMQVAIATDVSYDSVRNWERGKAVPSREHLAALVDLLACDPKELFEEVETVG